MLCLRCHQLYKVVMNLGLIMRVEDLPTGSSKISQKPQHTQSQVQYIFDRIDYFQLLTIVCVYVC